MSNRFIMDSKLFREQVDNSKHCEYCGHTLTFYFFENDRKCCKFCGRYNYRNDFIKFKYKLKEKGLKIEKCES